MIQHDVLVVGGGLAGLRAAIGLADRWDVGVLSRVHPVRSHSGAAQGGINAALANAPEARDDTPEKHAFDTIKGSDYLADQAAAAKMCNCAPQAVYEAEQWGTPFTRFTDGRIAQRPFGGAGVPRACYAADATGHAILQTLYEQTVKRRIRVYQEWAVVHLIVSDGLCHGVVAYDLQHGTLEAAAAKFVVFATGGYGRLYRNSTNALINTGSGIAVAFMAGVPIKDMEFIQFHPTSQYGTNILITEGARGEGGHLVNRLGERFMERYAPKAMELAPRDIVSRAIQSEIDAGRAFENSFVHLDLRHLGRERILKRLPGIRDICLHFGGLDPIKKPIPIQPSQHYSMGGIDTDIDGKSPVSNFYAAGECACVSVHGANRLGGNSLLETLVYGRLVAEAIGVRKEDVAWEPDLTLVQDHQRKVLKKVESLMDRRNGMAQHRVREELRALFVEKVWIFRNEDGLRAALDQTRELREQFHEVGCSTPLGKFNGEVLKVLELEGLLWLAEATVLGALLRRESRGSHARTDFPQRNDRDFLKHTIATLDGGEVKLSYSDVDTSIYEPKERTY